jgi:hypothetical protein
MVIHMDFKKLAKKGLGLSDVTGLVLTLVVLAIVIGVGVLVTDKFGDAASTTQAQTAINATRTEIAGIGTNWMGIITIIVIAAVVLGVIFSSLMGKAR